MRFTKRRSTEETANANSDSNLTNNKLKNHMNTKKDNEKKKKTLRMKRLRNEEDKDKDHATKGENIKEVRATKQQACRRPKHMNHNMKEENGQRAKTEEGQKGEGAGEDEDE